MDAITNVPAPLNEVSLNYAPGSPERVELAAAITELERSEACLGLMITSESWASPTTPRRVTHETPSPQRRTLRRRGGR